jgi:hypothetical protein
MNASDRDPSRRNQKPAEELAEHEADKIVGGRFGALGGNNGVSTDRDHKDWIRLSAES